jgi:hypothetical protein
MAFIAGLRGTGSFGADERPKNFREMILWMNPNGRAPLFALSSKMKTESVDDPEFSWWEETLDIARITLTSALTTAATTTVAATGGGCNQFVPGDLLLVESAENAVYGQEIIKVVTVTSDTQMTVAREVAGTTALEPTPIGTGLLRIGSAHAEGTLSPNSVSSNPTKFRNYTQIFKTAFEQTNTSKATRYRTGDAWKNDRRRKSFVHSEKIEQALMWGQPHEATGSNGQPERYTGGLRSFITSHNTIFSVSPTIDTFINAVSPVYDYDADAAGDERIVFCGNGAINKLNSLVKADDATRVNYQGVIEAWGMKLNKFVIPQGTLYFKTHPLLNVHPVYKNSMFVTNPAGLVWRPLSGRDTKLEQNIQANDADFRKDQWITEAGLELHFERTFAYIGNFQTI